MILKLFNWQGIAGIAATLALSILLVIQKRETSHWKRQSATFEQLYHQEQSAFARTVADYRAAAAQAEAAEKANAERVAAQQRTINQRTENEFESRLATARADARRLRHDAEAPTDSGAGTNAQVPGLPASVRGTAQAAGEDQLPQSDALTATEQAIQLDELIKWIKAQAAVDPSAVKK